MYPHNIPGFFPQISSNISQTYTFVSFIKILIVPRFYY